MYRALYVKYPLFLSDFNKSWIIERFKKYSDIKFHENHSSGRGVVPYRQEESNSLFSRFYECV